MTGVPLPNEETIVTFWRWFSKHAPTLEKMINESAVGDVAPLMEKAVLKLTRELGWEIGPGIERDFQLAFTLKGKLENAELANAIIRYASPVARWEFHAGRPPKKWDLNFSLLNKKKQRVEIDAKNWEYELV